MRSVKGFQLLLWIGMIVTFAQSSTALGQTVVSGRHIYVMFPGVDSIWGSYLFLVSNPGTEPARLNVPVMLPKETIDFQGQENVGPDELKLGTDGGLTLDKMIPPGDTLLNIGFQIPARQGKAPLSFQATVDFESIGLFVWEDTLTIEGSNLEKRESVPFSGRNYDTWTLYNGKAGQTLNFEAQGLPEGRGRLWIIGAVMAGVLLLAGIGLAAASRPRPNENEVAV